MLLIVLLFNESYGADVSVVARIFDILLDQIVNKLYYIFKFYIIR